MTALALSALLLAAAPDRDAVHREILQLSDAQAAEVLPVLQAIDAEKTRWREARREALRTLRQDVESGAPEERVGRALQAYAKAEAEHRERLAELVRRAEASLTVSQRARLLLLLERSAAGRERPRVPRRSR